jgi:hypothetical protein
MEDGIHAVEGVFRQGRRYIGCMKLLSWSITGDPVNAHDLDPVGGKLAAQGLGNES